MKPFFKQIMMACLLVSLSLVCMSASAEAKYDAKGKRDPFIPLVGVDRPKVSGLDGVTSVEDIRLEGILTGAKGGRNAVINGEIVKENDSVGEVTIKNITAHAVLLNINGKDYTVNMPDERGMKSE